MGVMSDEPDRLPGQGPGTSPGHPDVIFCPGGPILLRGDHVVQDEDGNEY
ncbi:MAG: hypothetical protein MOP51_960, partial [Citricoccus sp.]|nr:hypothetical protein [Citricoccus sp. WCRC_4]